MLLACRRLSDLSQPESEMIVKTGIVRPLFLRALVLSLCVALATPLINPAPVEASTAATFTFNGGGWGHGIGLSQYGAKGYADAGWTYDRILKHYFQGTRLVSKKAPTVRVNLDKDKKSRSQWQIQAGAEATLTVTQYSNRSVNISLRETVSGAPAKYWITTSGGNTRLHRDNGGSPGSVIKTFEGRAYVSATSQTIRLCGSSGPYSHTGVRWRGNLHFIPDTASASFCVNFVSMEDYLKGVVPRESPSSWPLEALKAQAVAARSYAYEDAAANRTMWCTTMSQVYNGHSRPGYTHEAARTNTAISATAHQLVWYGTESGPVKTYFSSSTGGHTANIEDVWFSAPKPYYKGVTDKDSAGNSFYTWTAGPFSASEVSTKVRARVGAANSSPAPHVVTFITLESASTGHARYASIRWSDGKTYKIKGDTLRSVLGLRSTRFTVTVKGGSLPMSVYSETNSNLAWSGIWSAVKRSDAYGGTYRQTKRTRSQMVAKFNGTGIVLMGTKAPNLGRASVVVDGKQVATIDLYAKKSAARQRLFDLQGLPDGEHVVTVTALSAKNSRSSGYGFTVDRVNITDGQLIKAATPVQRYQEFGTHVAELGGWKTEASAGASGGTHIVNTRRGAQVIVDFIGTGISWVGATGPGFGEAKVSVNGGTPVTVSSHSASPQSAKTVHSVTSLPAGRVNRLVIELVGPTASSAGTVSVDRFDVTGGWVLAPTLAARNIQESVAVKRGAWKTYRNTSASGGTHIVSKRRGDTVTVRFEGTSIAWYGAKTRQYGRAEVLLDGKRVATIDTYSPTTRLNQKLWSRSGLSAKPHTLTIKVLNRKRAASVGTLVSVDRFRVAGQLAPKPW